MLSKRITFILIPPNDGQVREFKFSQLLLPIAGVWALIICCAFGFYVSGYYAKVDQYTEIANLTNENEQLTRALQHARREVADLAEVMTDLAQDDRRLRSLHNMELATEDARLGGMGGFIEPDEEDMPEAYSTMPERKRSLIEDINSRIFHLKMEAEFQLASFDEITKNYQLSEEGRRALPTISPVSPEWAWKTSNFGWRTDPFTGRKAHHSGIDLAGRKGTKVVVTADGEVIYAYHDIRLGNVIVVKHDLHMKTDSGEAYTLPGTFRTEYGHLDKMFVDKGDRVERGQMIGHMGNTGRSTGPHLHYAVRYQNRMAGGRNGYVDPEEFLLDWPTDERVAGGLSSTSNE